MTSGEKLLQHGTAELPGVLVSSYNLDVKSGGKILNLRVRKAAFSEQVDAMRHEIRKVAADPLGDIPTDDLGKKALGGILDGPDPEAAAIVQTAVDQFANEIAEVLSRFLKHKLWQGVTRVAIGGGFKEGLVGERTIAAAGVRLKAAGAAVDLVPIRQHPDEAGLIGAAHLMPIWMFKGHDGLLAVDIGGTNIRAGVVLPHLEKDDRLSKAAVWKSDLWRHAEETPSRTQAVTKLIEMLRKLIERAGKEKLSLAPVIGVGCPGVIEVDGSIAQGGMNLPGGNWESPHFNLPDALRVAIPKIGDHDTVVIMHNDAVVQGLSQRPFMSDVERWGILTIGTGLGNASFTTISE